MHLLILKKSTSPQAGFTLIELMIVVGIVGILVAIAAPNFAKYQSKARQSEAKIALAAIYTGEQSLYSEYSAYLSSFDAVGYSPEGNRRFYSVGWNADNTATISGGSFTGSTAIPSWLRSNYPVGWTTCSTHASGLPAPLTGTDPQAFTVGARGQIRDQTDCDYWTITQEKVLSNAEVNL